MKRQEKTDDDRFASLTKVELIALCDRLLVNDSGAVEECIGFVEADTTGIWHNRARAMMARRFKHCHLSEPQRTRIVHAVLDRFESGRFSEQFKDQLRFALFAARRRVFTIARSCQGAAVEHVRRYAAWVLAHEDGVCGTI
jgi:hypothetical protein